MALQKNIRQDDGVVTNYHRILFLQKNVNKFNAIAVLSYVDEESRQKDETAVERVYRKAVTYQTDYNESSTVEDAYNYLKTLPQFEGAEDV